MRRLSRGSLLALGALAAVAAGCGGAPGPLSVRILYPYAGKGDRSFSDSAFEGLFRAMQQVDFDKVEVVPRDHDEAASVVSDWLAAPPTGRELSIVVGYPFADILAVRDWDVAGHPLLMVDTSAPDRPDLLSVSYRTFAPSYLAGLHAARLSASGKVSAIGGMPSPTVNDFLSGFGAGAGQGGAQLVGPLYLAQDASGFSMVEQARVLALGLASEQGVDVIFPVAGASGLGVIEAAKEYAGSLLAVGVDADQSYLGPREIIGSVVKRIDRIVLDTILAVAEDRFSPGQLSLGLETEDTDFVPNPWFDSLAAPPDASDRADAVAAEAAYLAGEAP